MASPAFFARVAIGQALAGRADIDVLIGNVAEVLLAEAALRLGPRGQRLGQGDRDPGPSSQARISSLSK